MMLTAATATAAVAPSYLPASLSLHRPVPLGRASQNCRSNPGYSKMIGTEEPWLPVVAMHDPLGMQGQGHCGGKIKAQ